MTPPVTILIPTYARTALLAEALESALRQNYAGVVEVLVLNDCPWQQLKVDQVGQVGRIRVVNAAQAYPTLGTKRQAMLALARTEFIAWLDDDDLIMPWYLAGLAEWADRADTIAPASWFRYEGRWSWGPMPGGMPMLVRRTRALEAGFDPALDVGEDNAHRALLTFGGERRFITAGVRPAYCYRTPGTHAHISRCYTPGDPRRTISAEVFREDAAARLRSGLEPTGVVTIRPAWREDYWATLARLFPRDIPAPP